MVKFLSSRSQSLSNSLSLGHAELTISSESDSPLYNGFLWELSAGIISDVCVY